MHFKNLLVLMSYVTIIILIIVSYNAIVPEDEIPVFKNEKKLVKKVENNFKPNEDSIYDIIENKESLKSEEFKKKELKSKKIKKTKNKDDDKLRKNKIFRVQVASFKEEEKSIKISNKLNKQLSGNIKNFKLTVKKIMIGDKEVFFRVVSEKLYNENRASFICKEIIKNKNQCIMVRDSF